MKGIFEERGVEREFRAHVGTTFHLRVEELKIRMRTTLVGLEHDEYLIVKMPKVHHMGNTSALFPKGNDVFVRFTQEGSVFGFQAEILGTVFSPRALLFLSYPEFVEIQNHRAHDRYACDLPVFMESETSAFRGSVTDIGKGGCRVLVPTAVDTGHEGPTRLHERVRMRLRLPGGDEGISLLGLLRHMNEDGESMVCGVEFDELDTVERAQLYDFILELGSVP